MDIGLRSVVCVVGIFCVWIGLSGCQSPKGHREDVDKAVSGIITDKQQEAIGKTYDFSIERPSDILRRRLLVGQDLPYSGPASLGTEELNPLKNSPEKDYPLAVETGDYVVNADPNQSVTVTLLEALQIGARNSFSYQTRKEGVFRSALDLELERDVFRNTFLGQFRNVTSTDQRGSRAVTGTATSGAFQVDKLLKNGADLSAAFAIDLANLFTQGGAQSLGLAGDGSVSIPLLRGSGEFIVTEPLKQAERNVVYAMWDFERFKKEFAVDIASRYLAVLRQLDSVTNSEADYKSRVAFARRSRRLADAGDIREIDVDQAVQNELSARQRWISAMQSYKRQLDSFKIFLGLPPDASLYLDPNELTRLSERASFALQRISDLQGGADGTEIPPADAPIILRQPDYENTGPYEIDEERAIQIAFTNRLDLMAAKGGVFDAQRAVVVSADALGAELTLFGSAELGERRTVTSADLRDARIRTDKGVYSAALTLDLGLERTLEAVNYRNSYINLERAVRDVQALEDDIKFAVMNELRDLLEARESVYIQAQAVYVAEKRVRSVNMFLEAGRAQARDLLEAQDALLSAQNDLTSAIVDYRIAELNIQRDMGVLEVNENGLWREFNPENESDVQE